MAAYLKSLCAIYSRAIVYLRFEIKVAHILLDRYLDDVLARSLSSEVETIRLMCERQDELTHLTTKC